MKALNVFKALRKVINKFKASMNLKQGDFYGSNALWDYVMVNVSLRSHIIHHDQSGLSCPFYKREKYSQYNIYSVVKR